MSFFRMEGFTGSISQKFADGSIPNIEKIKRALVTTACISLMVAFTGCTTATAPDEVSKKMMSDIEALGEITLEDEDQINKLIQTYSTLTDVQKSNVSNYVDLLNAQDKIDELKNAAEEQEKAEKEALLNDEGTQAVLSVIRQLKKQLKHPESLKLYSVEYLKGPVEGIDNDVYLVYVDYEADNDVGGTRREPDSIGVAGFDDGSSVFYNKGDAKAGDYEYNMYLVFHIAWMKDEQANPDSVISADVDFIMDNL